MMDGFHCAKVTKTERQMLLGVLGNELSSHVLVKPGEMPGTNK